MALGAWVALRGIAGVLSAWTLVATSAWTLQQLARAGRADLSGMVYAGVGLGIALPGCFASWPRAPACRRASFGWSSGGGGARNRCSRPRVEAVGGLRPLARMPPADSLGPCKGLVICYGVLGFGYILPATFLPALAREVVDNPQMFGLAWPVFGLAAALSTVATARLFGGVNRLRVWAVSHLLMAAGVVLPSLWLTPATIAIAALWSAAPSWW